MNSKIQLKNKEDQPFILEYKIIRSKRKTCSLELNADDTLTVRIPLYGKNSDVIRILKEKQFWIAEKLLQQQKRRQNHPLPQYTETQRLALEKRYRSAAREYIPQRVAYYADAYSHLIKHPYSTITIRDQKTRWGSCSSRGTLSFNWRLMLAPPGILDYVVVHELCHLEHMNHSKDFWSCVEAILPDYKERRKWLKEHGQELTFS